MVAQTTTTQTAHGLEAWLRSPARRFGLIIVATLIASVVTTFQLYEVFDEFAQRREELTGRRPEFNWSGVWQLQLITWGIWGAALEPILWLAGFLNRTVGSWILIALLQLPLSYGAAYGSVELTDWISDTLLEEAELIEPQRPGPAGPGDGRRRPPEGERRPGPPLPGDAQRPPRRPRQGERGERGARGPRGGAMAFFIRSRKFRMPRAMSIYWVILALGAGVSAFLRARVQEEAAATTRLNNANLETQLARAQMDSLKSQLQPHFLFNSLHTVGGLIRADDQPGAVKMISALGGLLRKTLDLGESQRVLLSEELEIAELYLSIEKIRFGERLVTVVDASDDALQARVPALLLLPLVENAVRYAVEPRVEGGRVEVEVSISDGKLSVEVRDDGPGFPGRVLRGEPIDDGRSHIGLENSRRRLEMLYGDDLEFALSNDPEGGACVRIKIPIERETPRV